MTPVRKTVSVLLLPSNGWGSGEGEERRSTTYFDANFEENACHAYMQVFGAMTGMRANARISCAQSAHPGNETSLTYMSAICESCCVLLRESLLILPCFASLMID